MGLLDALFPGRGSDDPPPLEEQLDRYDERIASLQERLEAAPPPELQEAHRRVARHVAAGEEPPAELLEERDRLESLHGEDTLRASVEELRRKREEVEERYLQKLKQEGEREAPEAAEAVVHHGRKLADAVIEVHDREWAAYQAAWERYRAVCKQARDAAQKLRNEHDASGVQADLPSNLDRRLRREERSIKAAERLMSRIER